MEMRRSDLSPSVEYYTSGQNEISSPDYKEMHIISTSISSSVIAPSNNAHKQKAKQKPIQKSKRKSTKTETRKKKEAAEKWGKGREIKLKTETFQNLKKNEMKRRREDLFMIGKIHKELKIAEGPGGPTTSLYSIENYISRKPYSTAEEIRARYKKNIIPSILLNFNSVSIFDKKAGFPSVKESLDYCDQLLATNATNDQVDMKHDCIEKEEEDEEDDDVNDFINYKKNEQKHQIIKNDKQEFNSSSSTYGLPKMSGGIPASDNVVNTIVLKVGNEVNGTYNNNNSNIDSSSNKSNKNKNNTNTSNNNSSMPILSVLTPRFRKKLNLMPRPTSSEKNQFATISHTFFNLVTEKAPVDVNASKSIYGILRKTKPHKPTILVEKVSPTLMKTKLKTKIEIEMGGKEKEKEVKREEKQVIKEFIKVQTQTQTQT